MTYFQEMTNRAEALKQQEHVRILSLETSCDETAAAVVEDGRKILSNAVIAETKNPLLAMDNALILVATLSYIIGAVIVQARYDLGLAKPRED